MTDKIWTGIIEQWKPYQISVLCGGTWMHFDLHRTIKENPETTEYYCDWEVWFDGERVLSGACDTPIDEHDTEEIIDILNTHFELELY